MDIRITAIQLVSTQKGKISANIKIGQDLQLSVQI